MSPDRELRVGSGDFADARLWNRTTRVLRAESIAVRLPASGERRRADPVFRGAVSEQTGCLFGDGELRPVHHQLEAVPGLQPGRQGHPWLTSFHLADLEVLLELPGEHQFFSEDEGPAQLPVTLRSDGSALQRKLVSTK